MRYRRKTAAAYIRPRCSTISILLNRLKFRVKIPYQVLPIATLFELLCRASPIISRLDTMPIELLFRILSHLPTTFIISTIARLNSHFNQLVWSRELWSRDSLIIRIFENTEKNFKKKISKNF